MTLSFQRGPTSALLRPEPWAAQTLGLLMPPQRQGLEHAAADAQRSDPHLREEGREESSLSLEALGAFEASHWEATFHCLMAHSEA